MNNMKEKRKILIDFIKWFDDQQVFISNATGITDEVIEKYLKSINNAQSESQTVIENEQSKEVCDECNGTNTWMIGEYINCGNCCISYKKQTG